MLADSAASAMAAVVSEMAALPRRPAHHNSNPTGSNSPDGRHDGSGISRSRRADASGNARTSAGRPPPRPLPEQLAAAGYLADLTWVLEGACGGSVASGSSAASSPAAAAPSGGLWAAHNALAAVAGWLEGSLQYAQGPDPAATLPSATLQAAVARAAVAMVGTAQRLLASGAGAGASGSSGSSSSGGGGGGGYSSPVRGSRQPWRADSALCRMAYTGRKPLYLSNGFLDTQLQIAAVLQCAGKALLQKRALKTCKVGTGAMAAWHCSFDLLLDIFAAGASILAGFCATSSLQLVAAQHGGAPAVAQAIDIAVQVCTSAPMFV